MYVSERATHPKTEGVVTNTIAMLPADNYDRTTCPGCGPESGRALVAIDLLVTNAAGTPIISSAISRLTSRENRTRTFAVRAVGEASECNR